MPPKGWKKPVDEISEETNEAMLNVITAIPPAEVPTFDLSAQLAELQRMREAMEQERVELAALKAKLETQTFIKTEVSEALRLQQEETKRKEFGKLKPYEAPPMPPKPDEKLFTVRLDRNYAPKGYYEVVGYHQDEIKRKDNYGREVVIQPAAFIENEKKPPNIGGVGSPTKIWAGTVLRVPETEARDMRRAGIGGLEFD